MDVYKEIGLRIREMRQRRGDSQTDLATRLNMSRATISRYEDGSIKIDLATLRKIADYYGRSFAYFLGRETEEQRRAAELRRLANEAQRLRQEVTEVENTIFVPLIGTVPGHYTDFRDEEEVETFYPIHRAAMHPEGAYCLQVTGSSMADYGIFHGDIVFVDKTLKPEDWAIVIARKDNEALIRVCREDDDGRHLEAATEGYRKLGLEEEEIIGVVVESRRTRDLRKLLSLLGKDQEAPTACPFCGQAIEYGPLRKELPPF